MINTTRNASPQENRYLRGELQGTDSRNFTIPNHNPFFVSASWLLRKPGAPGSLMPSRRA